MAEYVSWPRVPVQHQVQIRPAYAAIGDLDEHFVWTWFGYVQMLNLDLPVAHVDRRRHGLGHLS